MIVLRCMDLNYMIKVDQSQVLKSESTRDEKTDFEL